MTSLRKVRVTGVIVFFSTIDVYSEQRHDEDDIDHSSASAASDGSLRGEAGLEPYGLHRLRVERFVCEQFPSSHLIVRLPALVGPHLKKNVAFDLVHGNIGAWINPDAVFQTFPLTQLWRFVRPLVLQRLAHGDGQGGGAARAAAAQTRLGVEQAVIEQQVITTANLFPEPLRTADWICAAYGEARARELVRAIHASREADFKSRGEGVGPPLQVAYDSRTRRGHYLRAAISESFTTSGDGEKTASRLGEAECALRDAVAPSSSASSAATASASDVELSVFDRFVMPASVVKAFSVEYVATGAYGGVARRASAVSASDCARPRVAVSMLAFPDDVDWASVLPRLAAEGVTGLEVVPTKIAPWGALSEEVSSLS